SKTSEIRLIEGSHDIENYPESREKRSGSWRDSLDKLVQRFLKYNFVAMQRNIVGARVRRARKSAKPQISQIDLVARLQLLGMRIEQSSISKIENGQRPVLDVEVVALAKALKVSVAWLLGEKDTP
ncbi:MAG: helix-turn-helix domain-containing protein, partial [Chloroflexota bacterium]|nr:helix-turn-helix domain-containing protein [Chloroflexota bacterium]